MIDILCPVLGRLERTEPFAQSLSENTTNGYRLLFICSPEDKKKIKTCKEHGEVLVVPWRSGGGDYAKKINHGFSLSENEWVLCGADDLRFYPEWDTRALVCGSAGNLVVGTNDLHNPAVLKGRHSTHPLFHRSYIEEYGSGTKDRTGSVLCELYDHQFVDTEFCETSMERGEWVFCKESIVEHLHPYWGLAPYDKTYTKALRRSAQDQKLYFRRNPRPHRSKR